MLVAGSVQLLGRAVRLIETEAPPRTRDYKCSNTKMADRLGFVPNRSVVEAVSDMLQQVDLFDRTTLTDPRYYNIRWIELLNELAPRIERFGSVL